MAIAIAATKNNLADRYGTLGSWWNCCTGNPGSTSTPANEATGGGNARKQAAWGAAAAGVITGSACIIDLAAGTYTYGTLCSASSGNNQIDNCTITSTTLSATGQIVLTPSFTVT